MFLKNKSNDCRLGEYETYFKNIKNKKLNKNAVQPQLLKILWI